MIKYFRKIIDTYAGKSEYKRNVLTMILGRVIGQVIPILITPLLTRIYSPEEFGIFAVYSTIVIIVSMASNGRYCLVVILPKEDEEAKDLVVISSVISFISTVFFIFLISAFGSKFFELINSGVLEKYIWVIVMNVLSIALHEALFYYALRLKKYKTLAKDVIFYTSIVVIVRLALGYAGYTEFGLLASYMVGYVFSFLYLFFKLSIPKKFISKLVQLDNLKPLMMKYSKFPRYSLVADTMNLTALMSPNLFLNKIFGSVTAGYFSMADKVLGSPIWLITLSVGDVFKQEASEQLRKKGSCYKVFIKTARSLFLFGFLPFLALFIVSPYIFPFILGENWEPVGKYVRIFSLMYFAKFVVNPVSHVVYMVNKQNYNVFFQSLKILSIVIAFSLGYLFSNVDLGLMLWSGLTAVSYVIIYVISRRLAVSVRSSVKS